MPEPAADLADQLRPVTVEGWPAFYRAMHLAFHEVPTGEFAETPFPVAELDRSLGLWDGDRVVATAGIYTFELTVPGAVAPCAGITWITVSPTHRRRGVLTAIMRRQLTELHEQQREPVAALWAAEAPIYGRFGYGPATYQGRLHGRTERLNIRPEALSAGCVDLVSAAEYRAAAVGIHDVVRRFVPGNLRRDELWWDRAMRDIPQHRKGATERQYLLHREPDGTVSGYAAYRTKEGWTDAGEPDGTLTVEEVRGLSTPAYATLWQYLFSVDLIRTVKAPLAPGDDPLRYLVRDERALQTQPFDALWVRLVDVDRALAARRYTTPVDLVLGVRDPFCPWNDGRWRLTGHPAGGHCARTDRDPDLIVDVDALGAAYLGGVSLATLQAAGRVTECSPGAVTQAATAFRWPVTPWCPDEF